MAVFLFPPRGSICRSLPCPPDPRLVPALSIGSAAQSSSPLFGLVGISHSPMRTKRSVQSTRLEFHRVTLTEHRVPNPLFDSRCEKLGRGWQRPVQGPVCTTSQSRLLCPVPPHAPSAATALFSYCAAPRGESGTEPGNHTIRKPLMLPRALGLPWWRPDDSR